MKIPLAHITFTTGIPPIVKGSSNIVTDENCEIWFDTDIGMVFVRPLNPVAIGGKLRVHLISPDGCDMWLKFPEEFPGWQSDREAPKKKAS